MIYNKTNPKTIQQMFGSIAKRYDRTNALLSFRLHRFWNRKLARFLLRSNDGPLLDLCCGTGDIAIAYLNNAAVPKTVYLLDFCEEMLECARSKMADLSGHELFFINGDAQSIPLPNEAVSSISIAYGIRNVRDPLQCFKECFRALKEDGVLGILELTRPSNLLLRMGHAIYLKTLLPILGKIAASNREAYHYLCNSIQSFLSPNEVKRLLFSSGFAKVDIVPVHGGIATIWLAKKNFSSHKGSIGLC